MLVDGETSSFLPSKPQGFFYAHFKSLILDSVLVFDWPIWVKAGRFVRMFCGPVNVRALRKDVQLKVKEEYNRYRVSIFFCLHVFFSVDFVSWWVLFLVMEQDKTALLFLFFPATLLILRSYYWGGCLPAFPVQLYEVFKSLVLGCLNIVCVGGSWDESVNLYLFTRLGCCFSMLGWLCVRIY